MGEIAEDVMEVDHPTATDGSHRTSVLAGVQAGGGAARVMQWVSNIGDEES